MTLSWRSATRGEVRSGVEAHRPSSVTHGSRRRIRGVGAGVVALGVLAGVAAIPTASAEAPPPQWTKQRILDCDGQTVHTYLSPPGFGTPFNVVDSTDVIIPKLVQVVLPDGQGPFVTLNVPGFDGSSQSRVWPGG